MIQATQNTCRVMLSGKLRRRMRERARLIAMDLLSESKGAYQIGQSDLHAVVVSRLRQPGEVGFAVPSWIISLIIQAAVRWAINRWLEGGGRNAK